MSVLTRCGAVGLLLGFLASPFTGAAFAEGESSSWTDPPVRGATSAEPTAPVQPPAAGPEVKPAVRAEAPAEAAKPSRNAIGTPAERAAAKLGVKPVEASSRQARASHRIVRPRMVERPLVIARRPARIVERLSHRLAQRLPRRMARGPLVAPGSDLDGRVDPYDGRSYATNWSRRRMAGWDGLIGDDGPSRIGRARGAGYLVMRMRTYEAPDGTRVRHLSPYEDGFGDPY